MQSTVLDRPVIDKTELPGRFDFTLTWTPDDSQFRGLGGRAPAPSNDPNAPPGLFTAIQEQLGLRLESTRAPVDVLVVDRVERPSDNRAILKQKIGRPEDSFEKELLLIF